LYKHVDEGDVFGAEARGKGDTVGADGVKTCF
jgi:hypothetical protein